MYIGHPIFNIEPKFYNGITIIKSAFYFYGGPVWGIQRTYKSNFNITFYLGLGFTVNEFRQTGIAPLGDLTLGYVIAPKIFKKQKFYE